MLHQLFHCYIALHTTVALCSHQPCFTSWPAPKAFEGILRHKFLETVQACLVPLRTTSDLPHAVAHTAACMLGHRCFGFSLCTMSLIGGIW